MHNIHFVHSSYHTEKMGLKLQEYCCKISTSSVESKTASRNWSSFCSFSSSCLDRSHSPLRRRWPDSHCWSGCRCCRSWRGCCCLTSWFCRRPCLCRGSIRSECRDKRTFWRLFCSLNPLSLDLEVSVSFACSTEDTDCLAYFIVKLQVIPWQPWVFGEQASSWKPSS